MRFEQDWNAGNTFADLHGSAARARRALLCVATLLPIVLLWGCAGIVSGQNSQAPPPQTYSISGAISPAAGGAGATVTLSGAANATATANSAGDFTFTGRPNGTYTITPSHAGYTFSPSSMNVTVSGANVTTGVNFTATAQTFSISGTISPSASGSGATVTLGGAASATTTANSSGSYTFTGLANGAYTITPSHAGYSFSPTSLNATVNGANVTGINFTDVAQTYSLSGTISPVAGGSGATVTLSGAASATTTANSSGNYTFTGLANGTYSVAASHTGYTVAPSSQNATVNGANITGVNFTATPQNNQTYSISGTISPAAGGSGATVALSGAATATAAADSSGNYVFSGLANGTYTVTPTHTGYTFTPASKNATVNGANITGVNFTVAAVTFSVSGTISPAGGGSGATVALSGSATATVTADSSGNYLFSGLADGTYTITPTHTGYTMTPASQNATVNGANVSGVNFTATPIVGQTFSISGTISPAGGGSGATVALGGAATSTTTADSSGNYVFSGFADGTYTVTPTHAGYTISPASQNATINGANVTGVNFTATVQTSSGKWVTGYYANWQESLYPTNRIDYTALTHIVLAHWLPNADGTIGSSGWDTAAANVTTPAHAAGDKVLMMLGGSDGVNFASAASATNRATLVNSILAKVNALGLDGVDLDWEVAVDTTNLPALAAALRAASPGLVITVPVDMGVQPASLAVALSNSCDQVNMMSYGGGHIGGGWVSWYFEALAGDGPTHPSSINKYVTAWTTAGVPPAKIGIGIGFYSIGWTAPVTGALQAEGAATIAMGELPYGASAAAGGGVLSWFYNKCGTYVFDTGLPQAPSISIPGGCSPPGWGGSPITWVTFEDQASIAAKTAYVQSNNLGGVIIWTLNEGATDPVIGRSPQLDSVKLGVLKKGPAPTPQLAMTTANVGGAATVTLTGLTSNLEQVDVSWWNGNTGFDEAFSTWGSYGRPSEYYIEASTNGSAWTSLTHITGNSYSGRQFVYDFTGKGYTQVRMRIISIVGSNAGNLSLKVNSTPNNATDTYLVLGDSITSNCWDSSGSDLLANAIHALVPGQYPVVTQAGIPGQLASSILSTTPYGIPAVRQWLNDWPAAKYVLISYGTNDSNGNIPAATYAANIQAIVQEVIAAGKTPVIPTIVASPSAAVQANAPAMNAALATLEANYPSIIKGPDLWTLFSGHSVADGWFFDNLHPSLTTGCSALENAWANTLATAVYAQ